MGFTRLSKLHADDIFLLWLAQLIILLVGQRLMNKAFGSSASAVNQQQTLGQKANGVCRLKGAGWFASSCCDAGKNSITGSLR